MQGRGIEDVSDWAVSQLPLGPRLYPKVNIYTSLPSLVPAPLHIAPILVGAVHAYVPAGYSTFSSGAALCVHVQPCMALIPKPWFGFYAQDVVAQQPERFFVAEILREKIFLQYSQEVPYCTAVRVQHSYRLQHTVTANLICI